MESNSEVRLEQDPELPYPAPYVVLRGDTVIGHIRSTHHDDIGHLLNLGIPLEFRVVSRVEEDWFLRISLGEDLLS
ncbi:MAG: hypothetical protein HQ477_00415 [Chloroflexi bacterium]|nr:hypothetical protein [Chloroflexota bacterium]